MQWTVPNVVRTFLYPGRHALGITAMVTVTMIAARLAAEQTARRIAPMLADHTEYPDLPDTARTRPYVHRPFPADPTPTLPLSRAEILGPDPVHELDYTERAIGGAL